MIFKFGKGRKLSDLTKLAEFLEKENIEYTMETDIQLQVGRVTAQDPTPAAIADPEDALASARKKATERENDPLWRMAPGCGHCEGIGKLDNGDKCLKESHYGGEMLV